VQRVHAVNAARSCLLSANNHSAHRTASSALTVS